MGIIKKVKSLFSGEHSPRFAALDILKYIGPGFLVTVGFIDPGNWASNIAAGSTYGYNLLWMVTLSTVMLIILQHNAAHLGIVTGLCLSEATTKFIKPLPSRLILSTAVLASISTSLAEVLGAAIALNMLFHIPLPIGATLVTVLVLWLLMSNTYTKIEKIIIGFVSLIGLSFIFELSLVHINWLSASVAWFKPDFPHGSIIVIMSVLGAVVMPHNIFLHSEVIQSRQWHLEDEAVINHQLKYEFYDTFFSMIIGWAINSAMIILAAAAFFNNKIVVDELEQAEKILEPILGSSASLIFALALLFAGISSTVTSGMAGGSIVAGFFKEPYDIKDNHTRLGVIFIMLSALLIIFFLPNAFQGLIISQMLLSVQLPITIFTLIYLTSSAKVMGKYKNTKLEKTTLWIVGIAVAALNIYLLLSMV